MHNNVNYVIVVVTSGIPNTAKCIMILFEMKCNIFYSKNDKENL
jgi:hypothetical protein